jgi:hypothetical protein
MEIWSLLGIEVIEMVLFALVRGEHVAVGTEGSEVK